MSSWQLRGLNRSYLGLFLVVARAPSLSRCRVQGFFLPYRMMMSCVEIYNICLLIMHDSLTQLGLVRLISRFFPRCAHPGISREDFWSKDTLGPDADPNQWLITSDGKLHFFRRCANVCVAVTTYFDHCSSTSDCPHCCRTPYFAQSFLSSPRVIHSILRGRRGSSGYRRRMQSFPVKYVRLNPNGVPARIP